MIFYRANNGKIKISKSVIDLMNKCISQTIINQKEYCGVLLGREIIDTSNIIIDKITEPSKSDIQQKYYFFRSCKYHQNKIIEEWKNSEGTCNYLGEWHTHLEDFPIPSDKDLKEWRKALRKFDFEGDSLFFIIIGMKEIAIWEGCKYNLSINKLSEI